MLHSVFSLITWITKLYIKQPVERPQHILNNYGHISWKAFELLQLVFEAFPDLIPGKVFLITFKFSYLYRLRMFLVSAKYREIITVKTVTLCKKLYFLKKIEAGTNFALLCQSRNMVGRKAYLYRPIKVLQCLTPARIQKCLT